MHKVLDCIQYPWFYTKLHNLHHSENIVFYVYISISLHNSRHNTKHIPGSKALLLLDAAAAAAAATAAAAADETADVGVSAPTLLTSVAATAPIATSTNRLRRYAGAAIVVALVDVVR